MYMYAFDLLCVSIVEQCLSMTRWRVIVSRRTTDVSSLAQCAPHANRNAIMRYTYFNQIQNGVYHAGSRDHLKRKRREYANATMLQRLQIPRSSLA